MMKVILSSILALLYANSWAASRIGPFGPITPSDREYSGTISATHVVATGTVKAGTNTGAASTALTTFGYYVSSGNAVNDAAWYLYSRGTDAAQRNWALYPNWSAEGNLGLFMSASATGLPTSGTQVLRWNNAGNAGFLGAATSTAAVTINTLPLAANAGAYFGGSVTLGKTVYADGVSVASVTMQSIAGGAPVNGSYAVVLPGVTGVYSEVRSNANDPIARFANNANSYLAANGGSVGVGTTNPGRRLSVEGGAAGVYIASFSASGRTAQFYADSGGAILYGGGGNLSATSPYIHFDDNGTGASIGVGLGVGGDAFYLNGQGAISAMPRISSQAVVLDGSGSSLALSGPLTTAGDVNINPGTGFYRLGGAATVGQSGSETRLIGSNIQYNANGDATIHEYLTPTILRLGVLPTVSTYTHATGGLALSGPLSASNLTATSTVTVQGNAFSVGTSTFVVLSGKVGIGIAAPTTSLDVVGTAFPIYKTTHETTATNSFNSSNLFLTKTTGQMADGFGGGLVYGGQDADAVQNLFASIGAVRDGADNSGALYLNTYAAGAVNPGRVVVKAGGNVGVGIASPLTKLHLSSGSNGVALTAAQGSSATLIVEQLGNGNRATLLLSSNDGIGGGADSYIDFWGNTFGGGVGHAARIQANNTQGSGVGQVIGNLRFATSQDQLAPTERMRISANGNVGIGTTNPLTTLDLAGGLGTYSRTVAQLGAITPTAVGQMYFCNNCVPAKMVVSTGTSAANFADTMGGVFQ